MADAASSEKAPKKSIIKGLRAEFNKIVWPDGETLRKQTIVVVAISVILGVVIALLDLVIKFGLNLIV